MIPLQVEAFSAVKEEKVILEESNKIGRMLANSSYYNSFKAELEDGDSSSVANFEDEIVSSNLSFYFQDNRGYIKKTPFIDSFSFNKLICIGMKRQDKYIDKMLNSCFPCSVNKLRILALNISCASISSYLHQLARISCRVQKDIYLTQFQMNLPQLKRFISAFKHTKKICFRFCEFGIFVPPDFSKSLKGTKIQYLNFTGCNFIKSTDLKTNQEGFENLIQGLSSSDFLLSIREILTLYCQIDMSQVKSILDKHKLKWFKKSDPSLP
ncbi:unnamed protein product [Moneuplotes crassus]|uniref:Uncharacterized protein n=1 Tax=Euplotes crassus TaxID=5936 RepID=A0AAD1XGC2_EUPCR|nr:unnamed protein product [Moneuplotes crassus]